MRIWWKKMGRISRCFQYTTNLKLQLHPRQTKTSQSGYYKIYIRIHPVSATEFLLHKRPEVSRRWVVGHLVPHAGQAIRGAGGSAVVCSSAAVCRDGLSETGWWSRHENNISWLFWNLDALFLFEECWTLESHLRHWIYGFEQYGESMPKHSWVMHRLHRAWLRGCDFWW